MPKLRVPGLQNQVRRGPGGEATNAHKTIQSLGSKSSSMVMSFDPELKLKVPCIYRKSLF